MPYTFHITLYDAAFFATVFIGFTFILLLGFTRRTNHAANQFLALALLVMVLWIARVLAIDIRLDAYFPQWSRLPMQFSLALGPLIFFYVIKTTRPDYKFRFKDLAHFSPLILELAAYALEVTESIKTGAPAYDTPAFHQLNTVILLLAFISVTIYLYQCYKLTEDFYQKLKFTGGDRYRRELQWLRNLLAGFSLLWLLWIPFTVVNYIYHFGTQAYYPLDLLLSSMMIWMAARAHLRPEVSVPTATTPFLKPLLPAELKQKGTWLKRVVKENRYYEDPELSLGSLAEKIDLSPHELSRIINTALKKSFNDFINEYRVADVARKMQDPGFDHITLLGIAYDAGFNSRTTFHRIFKQMTGKSPAEYKTEQKKEIPSYNLEHPLRSGAVILNQETTYRWTDEKLNRSYMYKNYLKIAWRNMIRNKTFSLVNIIGLSLGIAVCFIITMYVQSELSYDRYNKNADRIVRIQFEAVMNGGHISEASVMAPVAQAVKNDFPEVEDATRLFNAGTTKISYGTKSFKNDGIALVDPNFFSVFTLPLTEGSSKTALAQPGNIVISKAAAVKYFGNENPLGKALSFENNGLYEVTGVFDKIPDNSHFHYDLLCTMAGFKQAQSTSWMGGTFFTYLLLRPGASLAALQAKFPAMVQKYMGPQIQQEMGISLEQFRTKGNQLGFILQPLTGIHLHPTATNELEAAGNAGYVYIFGVIALFMLVIACINFINLATAGASKRAKEIGVRKVIGSGRSQLIAQFLTESALLVFVALVIAFVLILLFLPVFDQLSGKTLVFGFDLKLIAELFILGLVVVVAAGIYPAFFLSSFKPIVVLKGKMTGNNKRFSLRSGLVVFQFFISVSLIVGTIVVYRQMGYIQSKDLGYDKDQVLTIPNSYALGKNETVFKDIMLRHPGVVNATLSYYRPAGPTNSNNALVYPDGHDNITMKTVNFHVDEQYIPTLGMKIANGRNFSKDVATDSSAMILNEAAVKALGFTIDNATKQYVVQINSDKGNRKFKYHVVGVVKDFNFQSLHEAISPVLLTLQPEGGVIFKIHTTNIAGVLASIKKQWDSFNTGEPFTYAFLDDLYNKTYAAEQKTSTILDIFALLTVIVACLGLFGLVTYTAEQRVKELGVRKVLGASVTQITRMLSADFLKLVLIACLVAFPVSWWATDKWLQSFAYRTDIHWWIFALAAAFALLIAVVTLSFQAIKAAIANPVKSLRAE